MEFLWSGDKFLLGLPSLSTSWRINCLSSKFWRGGKTCSFSLSLMRKNWSCWIFLSSSLFSVVVVIIVLVYNCSVRFGIHKRMFEERERERVRERVRKWQLWRRIFFGTCTLMISMTRYYIEYKLIIYYVLYRNEIISPALFLSPVYYHPST